MCVASGASSSLLQVVEAELQRVPRALARSHAAQLWSILYLPQLSYVLKVQGSQLGGEVRGREGRGSCGYVRR